MNISSLNKFPSWKKDWGWSAMALSVTTTYILTTDTFSLMVEIIVHETYIQAGSLFILTYSI